MEENLAVERIVDVATRLFAELGFDGTPVGLVAEAAGVDTATLTALTGGKTELYKTVMLRAHEAEVQMVQAALASIPRTLAGLTELADAYLDFHVSNPHTSMLWMHRWMGDASATAELDVRYRGPIITMVTDAVGPMAPDDVQTDFVTWTIIWSVAGFITGGMLHSDHSPARTAPAESAISPETLEEFRTNLHALVLRMYGPKNYP
ncbi:TetR/AcrR family transcriptional regulator [Actinomadura luteofluorescens]|uniref:TetR/AcrR family transcriptional regulator n=1 Tax=Actinomadura luteofluorescens TaxID=46163 RepID=UPI003D91AB38